MENSLRQEILETLQGFSESVDRRFERQEKLILDLFQFSRERFDQIDERFERIDERFERIDERFERMEGRLVGLESGQEGHDSRLLSLELKFEEFRSDSRMFWEAGVWVNRERLDQHEVRLGRLEARA